MANDEYVSKKEFKSFQKQMETSMSRILDVLESGGKDKEPGEAEKKPEEKKVIAKAGPDKYQVNDEWEEAAKEILGEYLDHTEVVHDKTGGIRFTVVVNRELSNASQQELENPNWNDRRTKEVGATGMEGVIEWCKLIKSNLDRPR